MLVVVVVLVYMDQVIIYGIKERQGMTSKDISFP